MDVNVKTSKEMIRGYVSPDLKRLVKAVVGVRIDRDLTVSDVLEEAIADWLQRPENVALIEKHHLMSVGQ